MPAGQPQGVTEKEEHGGRGKNGGGAPIAVWMEVEKSAGREARDAAGAASAVEARRVKVVRGAKSFISDEGEEQEGEVMGL